MSVEQWNLHFCFLINVPNAVSGYVSNRDPVIFSATYPFLYFVMDANIHVALMAGKMVDPLNSRIL